MGTTRVVLAQPSGVDEPRVPQIQEDELCMRNAGVNLHDRVQNVSYFMEWDKQRQQQPALMDAVDRLMSSIARQQQPPQHAPPPDASQPQDVLPPPPTDDSTEDTRMDTGALEREMSQDDAAMGDGNGAHESECIETEEVAKET